MRLAIGLGVRLAVGLGVRLAIGLRVRLAVGLGVRLAVGLLKYPQHEGKRLHYECPHQFTTRSAVAIVTAVQASRSL